MNSRFLALTAAGGATIIYGLNHTIAKAVMPDYVGAFGFIFFRTAGAAILFWAVSFFLPNETIDRKDYLRFFMTALLGMCINMLSFFKGLELSTPVNSGIFATTNPIIILLLSYIFLKEKIGVRKFLGIGLGFAGALMLVLYGTENSAKSPNVLLGNMLFMVNSIFFSSYIIMVKPLTKKYHTITIMKWLFLMGFIMTFPITVGEFSVINWSDLPFNIVWRILFVIVGTTFLTYLLNLFALKNLQASTVGAFAYAQPIIAIAFAVFSGNDYLDIFKAFACITIMVGVYLVSKKSSKAS
ncbi:MAG: EamA family transporter [Flavobacteriales bacterium MED-G15]|nr:MAG: EamA family transporter [Flavobacteriales bacterium MED-G15]|tara:strand:- start:2303 stop:3196 length:894 start_codon:yes stop_codon:yes gene_type:complete